MELNEQQERIVKHESGPLLVVAGAGTGKTRVITERIKYLLEQKKVDPQQILALTFSNKAAEEMLNRLGDAMPLGYTEPWVSTFHHFADRILQESGLEIGLSPDYRIISYPQQYLLIKEHLFDFKLNYYLPLGNPTKFIGAMLKLFSRLQDEAITPEEFSAWVEPFSSEDIEKYKELASAYAFYQELKLKENKLDFGDLILWTLRLFKERPNVLKRYQDQFKYVLVDEFQDTNFAQFELIKLLKLPMLPTDTDKGAASNIMVVGDDDQAIYRFRGASLSNILEFRKTYPNAETVVLTKNYRSGQIILDSAYKLIQNNNPDRLEITEGVEKRLESDVKVAGKVQVLSYETLDDEAEGVVNEIISSVKRSQEPKDKNQEITYRDFAILARSNSQLDPFVAALRRAGIPYQLIGNRGLFSTDEVRTIIALAKWLANSKDSVSLFKLLSSHLFNVDSVTLQNLFEHARQKNASLWEILLSFSSSRGSTIENIIDTLQTFRLNAEKKLPTVLLHEILTQVKYIEPWLKEDSIENQLKIKNVNLFFKKIKQYEQEADSPNIYEFVDWLNVLQEAGENPAQAEIEDVDTVNLLTVHSAKGLEFKHVFVVNLVAGRFPSLNRSDPIEMPLALIKETLPKGDYHLQEERRLLYVAITRGKEGVYLTLAEDYGGARDRKPSGFLDELGVSMSFVIPAPFGGKLPAGIQRDKNSLPKALDPRFRGDDNKESTSLTHVSYSQLETFDQCPLKYKYRYVLQIPTLPSHSLSFGQVMHRTLRDFHREDLFNDTSLERLLEIYEGHFKELSEGYESTRHKQMRFEDGRKLLEKYHVEGRNKLGEPVFLEKKFTLNINGTKLVGSIDRMDKLENGTYEIIDYKTGSDVKAEYVKHDDQLTIYALATRDVLGVTPRSLALYFLESGTKANTTRTDKELDKKREQIAETIEQIKTSDFPPQPSLLCHYCEFKDICPSYKYAP